MASIQGTSEKERVQDHQHSQLYRTNVSTADIQSTFLAVLANMLWWLSSLLRTTKASEGTSGLL